MCIHYSEFKTVKRNMMRHLRGIVYDKRVINEWSLHLPFAQRIMNSMIHSSTGMKPCLIVFGREFSQEFIHSADGEESKICVLKGRRGIETDVNRDTVESLSVDDDGDDEKVWLRDIKRA